jgi:hypothetical protein
MPFTQNVDLVGEITLHCHLKRRNLSIAPETAFNHGRFASKIQARSAGTSRTGVRKGQKSTPIREITTIVSHSEHSGDKVA